MKMMDYTITFDNWIITAPIALMARQYDNLSREVLVTGELPEGYDWSLLVRSGSNMDILRLEPREGGVGVTLTREQLASAGDYSMQVRGMKDNMTQHTNVTTVVIPHTLIGASQWGIIPTEFLQFEERILDIMKHPPVPGNDGYWEIWNPDTAVYETSEFPLPDINGTTDYNRLQNLPTINGIEVKGVLTGEDLGIPAGQKGEQGDKGDRGDVQYATFDIDSKTGMLSMHTTDGYQQPDFRLNEHGYLEVIL